MSSTPLPQIWSVLHTTDFSPESATAFEHALRIALAARARFDILHVGADTPSSIDWSDFPGVRATLERWQLLPEGSARQAVEKELGILVAKYDLPRGDVVSAVSEFIQETPPDLLVLATEGREGLPLWLKSSAAERLSRAAMKEGYAVGQVVSTLFVPLGARGFVSSATGEISIRNVLVPVSSDPEPQIGIDAATAFVTALGADAAKIHALYVGPSGRMPDLEPPIDHAGGFERITRPGDPHEEIPSAQQELDADLIVMVTKGRDGFLDALRGSTTERVVRHAGCPVLAIAASVLEETL